MNAIRLSPNVYTSNRRNKKTEKGNNNCGMVLTLSTTTTTNIVEGFPFWGHLLIQICWYMQFIIHCWWLMIAKRQTAEQYNFSEQPTTQTTRFVLCSFVYLLDWCSSVGMAFYGDNVNIISYNFGLVRNIDRINICFAGIALAQSISILYV